MRRIGGYIIAMILLASCTKKMYLAPGKVNCNLPDRMQCFLVKKDLDDNWILSSEDYVGFDYQPGFQYKVKVKRSKVKRNDGTSKRVYKVLEVLEKIEKKKKEAVGN